MRNILLFVLLGVFAFASCTKEEVLISDQKENSIEESNEDRPAQTMYYKPSKCLINGKNGSKCVVSLIDYEECSEATDCEELDDKIINDNFTSYEIENWDNPELDYDRSVEYVEAHYKYFLHLYELGLSVHPDQLIEIYSAM